MTTTRAATAALVCRVVLIDDSPDDRNEIRRLLLKGSDRQYEFVEAENGSAGLRAVLDVMTGPPACVVLDYLLPDVEALEMLAAMIGPDGLTVCPVLVVTGVADQRLGPSMLRAGAQDFIAKNWMTAGGLTRAVENATERWAITRALQARTAALQVTQDRLQLAMDVAGLGIMAIDYLTDSATPDSAAAAMFGLEAGVPVRRTVLHARIHPDDHEEIMRLMNACLEPDGDGCFAMEHRVVRPDGSIRWLQVKKQALFSDVGGIRRARSAVLAAVDITARKGAAETIAQQVREMDMLYETVPTGLFQFDDALRFVRVNAWTARITGRSIDAHVGRTVSEVLPPELAGQFEGALRHVLRTGEPLLGLDLHGAMAVHTGELYWLASYYPVYGAGGGVIGVHGVIQDVTEQKLLTDAVERNRRTLYAVVEQCPYGIYLVDADLRFASVNTRSESGAFASIRPVVGRAFDDTIRILWSEPTAAEIIDALRHTLDTGEPYVAKDFLRARADVDLTEGYEWELHRVIMPDGRHGVVCYFYDSTELRAIEQQLKETDRRKDEFLATLAHELRNPLAPIRNGLELLKLAGEQEPVVEKARAMMERQLTQMVRLVDDLMDVSRISRGTLELRKERMPLVDVVNSALEATRPLARQMGHTVSVTLPTQPLLVEVDYTRLAQVFINLLNNAAKYSNRGGHIELVVEQQGGDVVVTVQDTGIGIGDDQLLRIFEMFTQVDSALEKSQGGLGIGLALVKRLVELHGGVVEATSNGPGQGSAFVVRLPIVVDTSPQLGVVVESVTAAAQASMRVLIVDDNRDAADSLETVLRGAGHDTRTAYDGHACLETAEEFRPDVIVLDIGLPTMNGYDVCRRIRASPWGRAIIVIAATGWGQDDDLRLAREAGFDHHMLKPVDPQALMAVLSGSPGGHDARARTLRHHALREDR